MAPYMCVSVFATDSYAEKEVALTPLYKSDAEDE